MSEKINIKKWTNYIVIQIFVVFLYKKYLVWVKGNKVVTKEDIT